MDPFLRFRSANAVIIGVTLHVKVKWIPKASVRRIALGKGVGHTAPSVRSAALGAGLRRGFLEKTHMQSLLNDSSKPDRTWFGECCSPGISIIEEACSEINPFLFSANEMETGGRVRTRPRLAKDGLCRAKKTDCRASVATLARNDVLGAAGCGFAGVGR